MDNDFMMKNAKHGAEFKKGVMAMSEAKPEPAEKKEERVEAEDKSAPVHSVHIMVGKDGFEYTVFGKKADGRIMKRSYSSGTPEEVLAYLKDDLMSPHMKEYGSEKKEKEDSKEEGIKMKKAGVFT